MARQRVFPAIPATPLTADGNAQGVAPIGSTIPFKVGQKVKFTSNTITTPVLAQIQQIPDKMNLIVGPIGGSLTNTLDISAFTFADNAVVSADEQQKPGISIAHILRYLFDDEPAVRMRTGLMDVEGNEFDESNPFSVKVLNDLIDKPHDDIEMTYNGSNQLITVVFKLQGATQLTLTLTYDVNNNLTRVQKS